MNQISKFLTSKKPKNMNNNNNKPKQLQRKFALKKNIEYSPPSDQALRTRSLDTSFRIHGTNENEFELICKSLGFSGPEDFAIPVAAWEARKANCSRSVSDVVLTKNERDRFKDSIRVCDQVVGDENGEKTRFLRENLGQESELVASCDENGEKTRFLRENMGEESGFELLRKLKESEVISDLSNRCDENGEKRSFLRENMGKDRVFEILKDKGNNDLSTSCDEIGVKTRISREDMGKECVLGEFKDGENSESVTSCDEKGEKMRHLRESMGKESGLELSPNLKDIGSSDLSTSCDEIGEKTSLLRSNVDKESGYELSRKLEESVRVAGERNSEFVRSYDNNCASTSSGENLSKECVVSSDFVTSRDKNNGQLAIVDTVEEMETLDRERVLNFSERLQDSIRLNDEMINDVFNGTSSRGTMGNECDLNDRFANNVDRCSTSGIISKISSPRDISNESNNRVARPVTGNGKNNKILASSTLVSTLTSDKTSSDWNTDDINAKSYAIMDPANRFRTSGGGVRPSIWDFSSGDSNSSTNMNKDTVVGSIGIKGTRPPVLAPPPSISNRVIDNTSSTWDIMRSFAPDSSKTTPITTPNSARGRNSYSDEEEDRDVRQRGNSTACLSESYSFTTTSNDDDSSSTTTEPMSNISPNGRFRRVITYWEKGDLLGRGSFGTVYEGIADGGYFIAVKEVSLLDQGDMGRQSIYQLEQEIALLSQFEHENIVQYYGTDKDEAHLYIFLELVTKGSLLSLYQRYRLRDSQVSSYTRQILHGLKYLHERNVVHRDIKCANILVGADGSVKLADFGLAKATKLNDVKSCKGTAFWMAPEVVRGRHQGYGLPADIWSLGCTVLEMLTHRIPYSPLECMQALYRIGRGKPPPIPDSLSRDARDFISRCLKVDPNDRPTAAQLLDHPFVKRTLPNSSGSLSPYHSTGRGLNLS